MVKTKAMLSERNSGVNQHMLQEHQKSINDETNEITMITGKTEKERTLKTEKRQ